MSSVVGRRARMVACVVTVLVLATAVPATAITVVRGDGSRWRPASVSIARGGAVKWRAVFRSHVVKAYGGNWSYRRSIAQGESVRRVFNSSGRFRYYCTIHGSVSGGNCTGMCGKVLVG